MGPPATFAPPRRLWRGLVAVLTLAALTGCELSTASAPTVPTSAAPTSDVGRAAQNFIDVVERVEPVAERVCRQQTSGINCDFRIAVDDRAGVPPNAFQTLDNRDRPIIIFTLPLIADARNADELAFILGHEAAHHIRGHIPRSEVNAQLGALVLAGLAQAAGQSIEAVNEAARVGATVGARSFAKEFELEADALGTRIAFDAGYDPVRGSQFFARIPDPGDRFLGTHPPNDERQALVRRTAATLTR